MVNSRAEMSAIYPVDEDCGGWRVLGWRLPSGHLRHGDYDVVNPDHADFDRLPVPNAKWNLGHSMDVSWSDLPMHHPKRMVDWRR
jgi:hypothetical protein